MKKLKDFLEVYKPKSPDEQKFVDKHVVIKHKDRNGNGDDVFKADNIKTNKRKEERHGYDVGEDEKVYEEIELDELLDEALDMLLSMDEKTLTPAEMKKREEVVKAIKRGDPKMDKSMAYAIATKTAKKVAEGTMPTADEPTDANKRMAQKVRDLLAKEKKPVKEDVDSYADALIKRNKNNLHKAHVTNAARIAGVDEKELMAAVNKKVGRIKEEAEDLDELSDRALKVYVGNAYNDYLKKSKNRMPGEDETDAMKKRKNSLSLAHKKLAKEEVEDLDELSVAKLKDYRTKARADAYDADDVDDERRYRKRSAGSNTAGKKIVRKGGKLSETAEDLDELSKATLQSYTPKAVKQIRSSQMMADMGEPQSKFRMNRDKKRSKGLDMADDKLGGHAKVNASEEAEIKESVKIAAHLIKRYGDNVRKSHVMSAAKDFGVDPSKLAKAVRTKLGKISLAEDDQIDELSKTTMSGYMAKASDARGHRNLSTKKVDNRYAGVKKASDKLAKEDVEQVDEISKAMAGRYINKAKDSIDLTAWRQGYKEAGAGNPSKQMEKKLSKRHKGIETAVKKLTREEAEGLDELSIKTLGSYVKKAGRQAANADDSAEHMRGLGDKWQAKMPKNNAYASAEKHAAKSAKRLSGIQKAVGKMTKEEAEHIDEISKKTLGSYIKKASGAERPKNVMDPKNVPLTKIAAYQGDSETGHFGKRFNQATYDKAERLRKNRETGITRAVNKLTKEDIINRTIEKYVPEDVKFTPEERLLRRLEGLSESHIDIIVGLFEQLNSDNKLKMIESAETFEGINQILNFALENRGE